MALNDQNLVLSDGQDIHTAFSATPLASTYTYDILTSTRITTSGGTYTVPPNSIIGNATYFGEDLGLGRGKGTPSVEVFSGATVTKGSATALQIALAGAPDNGGGTLGGLTFTAYIETGAIPVASILASIRLAAFDFPRRQVGLGLPRFIQVQYLASTADFTTLTASAYINHGGTSAQTSLGQYPSNY